MFNPAVCLTSFHIMNGAIRDMIFTEQTTIIYSVIAVGAVIMFGVAGAYYYFRFES